MIVERSCYSGRGPSGVDRLHPKISHRFAKIETMGRSVGTHGDLCMLCKH